MQQPGVENGSLERRQRLRAVVASTVGTSIEWYDFFLYGSAAALVFPKVFFTHLDPAVGAILSFVTFFFGFIGRPIGAFIFGHYGDRIGRKGTLIATLLTMGLATMAVGLVPGYAQIGFLGAICLTILRVIQGIGVGGEWGGSVLLSMEWAGRPRSGRSNRGFLTSWPQFGVPVGLLLANLAILFFSGFGKEWFLAWGWRIPFLLSGALILVGLYVRLSVLETPVFRRLAEGQLLEKQPVLEVWRLHWREILLSAFVRMAEQAPFYIFTAFILEYGSRVLKYDKSVLLYGVMASAIVAFVTYPAFGALSDRIGRKPVYIAGALLTGIWGFLYFGLLDLHVALLAFFVVALSLIPHDMEYGTQAALIAESFTPRVRYSGASIGYQLASIIAGGPAPLIATALVAYYHTPYAISVYIAFCAVVSIIAATLMRDRAHEADLSTEYEPARGRQPVGRPVVG
jgi:MFS family permease